MRPAGHDRATLSRTDLLWAALAGTAALTLFVATLQPDFGGPEDTPKFQFIGKVLGIPHPPGYPLYVLLSYPFVHLPIRTIAYRANLFSGVMAAFACALAYSIGRQIGSRRWAALSAALALATGAAFWRSAVFAEVYSLGAVMAALTVTALLVWYEARSTQWLLSAAAVFALGIGNHLTILGLVPAAVLFVLIVDRRVLSPRVLAGICLILLLGLSQYGFLMLRARQGAPYLESRATSVSELVDVITTRRFAADRFAFRPSVILEDHLPVLTSLVGRELGVAGAVLLIVGLGRTIRLRLPGAGLVAGAAAGIFGLVLNLSGDLKGFITAMLVFVWPLAALGLTAIAEHLEVWPIGRITGPLFIAAAVVSVPLRNLKANYADADRSRQVEEARFYRALFSQLPEKAAVVIEDYASDMAFHYFTLTGEGGAKRDLTRLPFDGARARDAARDHRVFAFGRAATILQADGLQFDRWALPGVPLDVWLKRLPSETVVVGAAAFTAVPEELLGVARADAHPHARPRTFASFAYRSGKPPMVKREDDQPVALTVDSTLGFLRSPAIQTPIALADARGARIEIAGGAAIAEVDEGFVLGAFQSDGTLMRALAFPAGNPLRVPFERAVYELKARSACASLSADGWTDVSSAISTGSWLTTFPEAGTIAIEADFDGASDLRADARELIGAGMAHVVGPVRRLAGVESLVTELTRSGTARPVFRLALDQRVSRGRARLRPGGPRSTVMVCAHDPLPLFSEGQTVATLRPDFESEAYFGAGWTDSERTTTGRVRRAGSEATLFLPLDIEHRYVVRLNLATAGTRAADVFLNNTNIGTCAIDGTSCEIALPERAIQEGINALKLKLRGVAAPNAVAIVFWGARIERRPRGRAGM